MTFFSAGQGSPRAPNSSFYPWLNVGHALILVARKRDRVVEVQCLRIGFIDH